MRGFYTLVLGVGFAFWTESVFGQVSSDTSGLTGTIADTIMAKRLLNEAIELNKQGKYEAAYTKADSSRMIFERVWREDRREIADAIHQMGRNKYYTGNYNESIILYEGSLAIRKKYWGQSIQMWDGHIMASEFHTTLLENTEKQLNT